MSFVATGMKLEELILNEVTQEWTTKYRMFSSISWSYELWVHEGIQSGIMNSRDSEVGRIDGRVRD